MSTFLPSSRGRVHVLAACVCILFAFTPSCRLIQDVANTPGELANDLTGGKKKSDHEPPSLVQAEVMRFTDSFSARITQATNDFADKAGTPEAHVQGLRWSINQNTAALSIATGNSSTIAMLDMIVLVTIGRMVHEDYWLPQVWGEADRPMLDAYTQLETDIWEIADRLLSPEQQAEVKAALSTWREENPDMRVTATLRLPVFEEILKKRAEAQSGKKGGLGDLLSLDPLSGLEPAVREIERTRLFAERTLFYVQRAPSLLAAHVELLGLKLARMPEVHAALDDTQRISLAAASLSETAANLPKAVQEQREAAVKQVSDELTKQREGLVADLQRAADPAHAILADAHNTFDSATQMSSAVQSAITTLDQFVGRFDTKKAGANAAASTTTAPAHPFDVREYGDAAARIGESAHELNGLVTSVDTSLPQVSRWMDELEQRGDRAIDHAFERGLELGLVLIAAAALATLVVRWILGRAPRRQGLAPGS